MIGTAAPFMIALAFLLAGNPVAASSAPTGTSETTATTAPDNALENGDGTLAARSVASEQLMTLSQLQPTRLKPVSRKKGIIIAAVVIAVVLVVTYVIAVSQFGPIITLSDARRQVSPSRPSRSADADEPSLLLAGQP
jgi:hypothetical protein